MRSAIQIFSELLTSENLPTYLRSQIHSGRAGAYDFIGDKKTALRDHNEAVRISPALPGMWENRALYWKENGRHDLAAADLAKAKTVRTTALKIAEVLDGGVALKAGLRAGDVILGVGTTRVTSFEELVAELTKAKGPVEIVIINGRTGKDEKISLTPVAGKIGVTVDPLVLD